MTAADRVILTDEHGTAIGSSPKHTVHGENTPLHLAFSCYLIDTAARVLVTRRALSKHTWPGVWTNSFCGHPRPGEEMESAIRRRADEELGTAVTDVTIALPEFRYRAVDASGIVENEICPVYTAEVAGHIAPNPAEVIEWRWVAPEQLLAAVTAAPFAFSPWLAEQLPQLSGHRAFTREGVRA